MRVLLTAGGTREPIDDVRVIANTSSGRLGARCAEAFARAGHEVTLLHGVQAERPTSSAASLRCRSFDTSSDLAELLREHAPQAEVVLHAAAVADYTPERATGKLASEAETLVLRLHRAPKLIDGLRELAPRALLVGFKLTSGKSEPEREQVAEALRTRARLDLVVSNDAARTGEHDHEALVFAAGGVVGRATGKRQIADTLVELVSARAQAQAESS
ncbi:MAG: phosphopantothenate--cysteine ligase [Planctomycetota bacterium]|nr:MAG: phosphopantothenate--cysteine ligase [Planctomycetota bacterium]